MKRLVLVRSGGVLAVYANSEDEGRRYLGDVAIVGDRFAAGWRPDTGAAELFVGTHGTLRAAIGALDFFDQAAELEEGSRDD